MKKRALWTVNRLSRNTLSKFNFHNKTNNKQLKGVNVMKRLFGHGDVVNIYPKDSHPVQLIRYNVGCGLLDEVREDLISSYSYYSHNIMNHITIALLSEEQINSRSPLDVSFSLYLVKRESAELLMGLGIDKKESTEIVRRGLLLMRNHILSGYFYREYVQKLQHPEGLSIFMIGESEEEVDTVDVWVNPFIAKRMIVKFTEECLLQVSPYDKDSSKDTLDCLAIVSKKMSSCFRYFGTGVDIKFINDEDSNHDKVEFVYNVFEKTVEFTPPGIPN